MPGGLAWLAKLSRGSRCEELEDWGQAGAKEELARKLFRLVVGRAKAKDDGKRRRATREDKLDSNKND